MKKHILLSLFVISIIVTIGCQPQFEKNTKYLDSDIEKKIDVLLSKMTLAEKLGQMTQKGKEGEDWAKSSSEIESEVRKGNIGSFLNVTDAAMHNRLQRIAVEESRLGIPLIFGFDVIHGFRTIFPVPLAEAASWDLDLMQKTSAVAAKEARAAGVDWTFAPMVDIARDPRWGRIVEGAGEDPYLGSLIARAKVKGYQGKSLSDPDTIAACMKHFAAYGAVQAGREYHTTEVPERVLRNIYLPPFKAGLDEGAATFMCGFNDLNGVPVSGNKFILTDILRNEWGFNGFLISDYRSVKQLVDHGLAKDLSHAGMLGVNAGVDMEMVSRTYFDKLPSMVRQGKISEKIIDQAVRRILRIKFALGLFDNPYVDEASDKSAMLRPEHLSIARQMVKRSMVLLKNDNDILPLNKDIGSIALIGPLADNEKAMLGTWSGEGKTEDVVTVLEGLKNSVSSGCRINYAKGCDVLDDSTAGFAEAIEAAKESDVIIMAIGETEELNGEAHSRTSIDLPTIQKQLVREIHKTQKPVVVLLFAGRSLTINWVYENMPSILLAWHPGVQAGPGITDVLFGDYNPSGKLTITFPRNVGQIPLYYNYKNTGRPAKEKDRYTSKYIDSPLTPLIPFGYGLSYTTFEYSNLKLDKKQLTIPGSLIITADIKNTGSRTGEEVVQLYIRDMVGSVTRPVKELKGFKKISLAPGQTKNVSFTLTTEDLKFYDINMEYNVEPGDFKVWVGPSSAEGLEGSFEIID